MNMLRKVVSAGIQTAKKSTGIKKSGFYRNKDKKLREIDLGSDAFFPATRWKMPKKAVGFLIAAVLLQFVGFAVPAQAQSAITRANEAPFMLANGAQLSALEQELLQKNLVILEKESVTSGNELDFRIAGVADDIPLNVQQTADLDNTQLASWGVRTITSYNSEQGQTDDSPCITANGFNVCEHGIEDTIAANFLKFGAKVVIPDLFGERVFVVRDRMNQRYPDHVDVWMVNKADAKAFGVRRAEIKVIIE